MTDEIDERKLYSKVMGIDEARKLYVPMPKGIKIPKKHRQKSHGGFCGRCKQNTLEGHEDGYGMWHYRCQYCIANQDPNDPNPCPRCGCKAHTSMVDSSLRNNPFRPEIHFFDCLNCEFRWYTPEFEKYIAQKTVKEVIK